MLSKYIKLVEYWLVDPLQAAHWTHLTQISLEDGSISPTSQGHFILLNQIVANQVYLVAFIYTNIILFRFGRELSNPDGLVQYRLDPQVTFTHSKVVLFTLHVTYSGFHSISSLDKNWNCFVEV